MSIPWHLPLDVEGGPRTVRVQLLKPSGAEGSSSHFGLQTDGSQQPSFVGMQSLQDYEQSRTSSVHVSTGGLQLGADRESSSDWFFPKHILRQRLDRRSGGNLSAVPEADNSQESDTNGGNGGHEDVRDSGDLFDNSQVDRSDTEQYSEQRWSDDEQNALPSPETQPLPGTTLKHPTQQCQHPVQSVPSQGGLPSRLPRNSHSQSVGRQAVGARRDGIHKTREANQEDRRPSKKTCPDAMLSGRQSAAEELMDVDNAKANSGKGSAHLGHAQNTVIVKPTTLAFYPPLWTKLLDKAKARIQLYVATEEPFLRLETAVDGQCSEEIIELVVKYQEDQSELEAGFYPQYKRSMAWMLFNDMQTFRSEIKKVAVRIVPIEYNLSAPKSATTEREWLDAVKQKATVLLEGAKFLRGECDSLGKASNFAHPALQNICLGVYYSNSVKSLHQYVEFQHFVPYKALALAAAIERHGFSTAESLNVGELEDSYQRLLALMDTVALDTASISQCFFRKHAEKM
ncbi:hypothetical protein BKA83DRAFT_4129871 [Pisolithus microcarpus]|nr:hypothetical protein BKA83DRAFT_4129871 [Pisolithus microcarpus]